MSAKGNDGVSQGTADLKVSAAVMRGLDGVLGERYWTPFDKRVVVQAVTQEVVQALSMKSPTEDDGEGER